MEDKLLIVGIDSAIGHHVALQLQARAAAQGSSLAIVGATFPVNSGAASSSSSLFKELQSSESLSIPQFGLEDSGRLKQELEEASKLLLFVRDNDEAAIALEVISLLEGQISLRPDFFAVCVSSLFTWASNGPSPSITQGNSVQTTSSPSELTAEEAVSLPSLSAEEKKGNEESLRYREKDYENRLCTARLRPILQLERRLDRLEAHKVLKKTIIGVGHVYGRVGLAFDEEIRKALESEPGDGLEVPAYLSAEGENFLPLIHCDDLSSLLWHTLCQRSEDEGDLCRGTRYIVATERPQQKLIDIVRGISMTFATGEVRMADQKEAEIKFLSDPKFLSYQPNLSFDMTQSAMEKVKDLEEREGRGLVAYEKGLGGSSQRVREVYLQSLGLRVSNIMFVVDPQAKAKHFASRLSQSHGIPLVTLRQCIAYVNAQPAANEAAATLQKDTKPLALPENGPLPALSPELQARVISFYLCSSPRYRTLGYILHEVQAEQEHLRQLLMTLGQHQDRQEQAASASAPSPLSPTPLQPSDVARPQSTSPPDSQSPLRVTHLFYCLAEDSKIATGWAQPAFSVIEVVVRPANPVATAAHSAVLGAVLQDTRRSVFSSLAPSVVHTEAEEREDEDPMLPEDKETEVRMPSREDLERLIAEERQLLLSRSQETRKYLNARVMPYVMRGLLEIVKLQPDDPMERLASFLREESARLAQAEEVPVEEESPREIDRCTES